MVSGPAISQPVVGRAATVRLLAGFAAFGAGSVNLAVSSSLLAAASGSGGAAPVTFGILAGVWGAALIGGAVVALNRGHLPLPALSGVTLLLAAGAHSAAIIWGRSPGSGLNVSHLAALLLTLMVVASLAWLRRQESPRGRRHIAGTDDGGAAAVVHPGRVLLAAFAGAVLVAGIATPGLAASTAGQFAVPHGQHGQPGEPAAPAGPHQPGKHQH